MWLDRASRSRAAAGLPAASRQQGRAPRSADPRGIPIRLWPLPWASTSRGRSGLAPAPGSAGRGKGRAHRRGPRPGTPEPRRGRAAATERGGEAPTAGSLFARRVIGGGSGAAYRRPWSLPSGRRPAPLPAEENTCPEPGPRPRSCGE